ncbi:hypothetical protein RHS04_08619 [Rhizoctonia solani]|uniref:Uncharacterized protein n=1 Tax=Rhizoctonia solani TaxID=456999 RepID=A0A8H7LGE1_9AGAM|nr:hypothetical protein RHS04_08619 [Rhizoctonia solani]
MSASPFRQLNHPRVPALSPVSGSSVPGTRSLTSSPAKPLIPLAARQRDGAMTMEMVDVKARLTHAKDNVQVLRSMILELQNCEEASKNKREGMAIRLKQAEAHSNRLEAILSTYLVSQGVNLDNLDNAKTMSELVVDNKGNNLSVEDAKALSVSNGDIMRDTWLTILQKIIKESLASIYGVIKFSPKEHGDYPKVSKAHPAWPSQNESGSQVALHRFDFKEEYNSPKNQPLFDAWVEHSLNHGPALSGVRHLPPSILNCRTLTTHCAKYYSSIKRQALSYHGKQKAIAGIKRRREGLEEVEPKQDREGEFDQAGSNTAEPRTDLEGQLEEYKGAAYAPYTANLSIANYHAPNPGPCAVQQGTAVSVPLNDSSVVDSKPGVTQLEKSNSAGHIRSRRMTKLATREKKRRALTGKNEKYLTNKYDSYFTLGAMSDKEQVETINKNGEKVVELVSHEYDFVSDELVKCCQAVDELPDPTSTSKRLKRRRGTPKPGPPPKSKKAKNGLCSWMIKGNVLAMNPQWFIEGRVYLSDSQWNLNEAAAEDPTLSKQKKAKLEKNPDLQLVQQSQAKYLHAKHQFEEWENAHNGANTNLDL